MSSLNKVRRLQGCGVSVPSEQGCRMVACPSLKTSQEMAQKRLNLLRK